VREERYTVDVAARTSRSIQRWESGDLQGAPDRYLWVTADNGRFGPTATFSLRLKMHDAHVLR
jgi:hypothetical protein